NPCGNAARNAGGRSCPNATATPSCAPVAATSSTASRARAGVTTRKPRSAAARLTGLGSSRPPRLRRLSGWVRTSATSCPASTSPRSGVTASAGVPRKTRRTAGAPRSERGTGAPRDHREVLVAERPQRALALVRLEAVEQQHAVEVVDLVLEQPG